MASTAAGRWLVGIRILDAAYVQGVRGRGEFIGFDSGGVSELAASSVTSTVARWQSYRRMHSSRRRREVRDGGENHSFRRHLFGPKNMISILAAEINRSFCSFLSTQVHPTLCLRDGQTLQDSCWIAGSFMVVVLL